MSGRPRMSQLDRQSRFIWRVEHGKACKQCTYHLKYDAFNRDDRRADNSASTCKACKRIQRQLKQAGLSRHWPAVRLAIRRLANISRYGIITNDPPPRVKP